MQASFISASPHISIYFRWRLTKYAITNTLFKTLHVACWAIDIHCSKRPTKRKVPF